MPGSAWIEAAGLAHVDSDQLGTDRGGDLGGSPQDVLTLGSASQRDDDPLGGNPCRCPA